MERKRFDKILADIEDESNSYAGFPYAYEQCVVARELLQRLHGGGAIGDEEFVALCDRIGAAKRRLVETSRAYVARAIGRSKSELTRENIVYSVYAAAFGHTLQV
jgi:hypothetical protein